jgi:hypothetical protein
MNYNDLLNYQYKIHLFGLNFTIMFIKDFFYAPDITVPSESVEAFYIGGDFIYPSQTNFPYIFIDEKNNFMHKVYAIECHSIKCKKQTWKLIFETQLK